MHKPKRNLTGLYTQVGVIDKNGPFCKDLEVDADTPDETVIEIFERLHVYAPDNI